MTSHYLNPVVPQNFTNKGTTGDFSVRYERDLTDRDRISLSVRHEISRYEIPNEQIQQEAGQLQNGDNFETMGIVSYQHIFSPDVIGDFRGMVRDNANNLYSNPLSTPVIAFQHNYFREGYFKGTVAIHKRRHEIKVGIESDNTFLHEKFNDIITDSRRLRSRHAADLRLHRQQARPRTVRLYPGSDPSRQIHGKRRPPLGSLPVARQ